MDAIADSARPSKPKFSSARRPCRREQECGTASTSSASGQRVITNPPTVSVIISIALPLTDNKTCKSVAAVPAGVCGSHINSDAAAEFRGVWINQRVVVWIVCRSKNTIDRPTYQSPPIGALHGNVTIVDRASINNHLNAQNPSIAATDTKEPNHTPACRTEYQRPDTLGDAGGCRWQICSVVRARRCRQEWSSRRQRQCPPIARSNIVCGVICRVRRAGASCCNTFVELPIRRTLHLSGPGAPQDWMTKSARPRPPCPSKPGHVVIPIPLSSPPKSAHQRRCSSPTFALCLRHARVAG